MIKKELFKIEKIKKNKICKNNVREDFSEKTPISNHSSAFSSDIPTPKTNPKTITYNNFSSNENNETSPDAFIYPNSLITISKEVFKYLNDKNRINMKTLNDIIINKISNSERKTETLSEKNIQRRVYDAINVMNAIGLIKKEKSSYLNFQGKMNLKNFENSNSNLKLNDEIKKKTNETIEKKNQLLNFYTKVKNEL